MKNEIIDVLIVGAGLSGIGAAVHLTKKCPGKSFAIVEARERLGGTWDLFRYPGIRSDSDMYTLGYNFKPWTARRAIADAPSILDYLNETVAEYDLDDKILLNDPVDDGVIQFYGPNSQRAAGENEPALEAAE